MGNKVVLAAAAALLLSGSGVIAAAPREGPRANTITLYNDTPSVMLHLYARGEGLSDWQEDILGDQVVEPGRSVRVNLDIGPNHCRFDIKMEFIDGDDVNVPRFDACKETELHATLDAG